MLKVLYLTSDYIGALNTSFCLVDNAINLIVFIYEVLIPFWREFFTEPNSFIRMNLWCPMGSCIFGDFRQKLSKEFIKIEICELVNRN